MLLTGTTGSGKSTTLAAMIDHINRDDAKPHRHDRGPDRVPAPRQAARSSTSARSAWTPASFKRALRRVLRQDPDVILVGEMRDEETVHTALTRGRDRPPRALDAPHRGRAGDDQPHHRLLPAAHAPAGPRDDRRHAQGRRLPAPRPTADGSGRVAFCEVMVMTGRVHDMIIDPTQTGHAREVIAEGGFYGMQTFDQHLFEHLKAGRITMEDAVQLRLQPARLQAPRRRRGAHRPTLAPEQGRGQDRRQAAAGRDAHPPSAAPADLRAARRAPPAASWTPRAARRSRRRTSGRAAGACSLRSHPPGAAARPASPPPTAPRRRPAGGSDPAGAAGSRPALDSACARSRQGRGPLLVCTLDERTARCRRRSLSSTRPRPQDAFALQNSKLLKVSPQPGHDPGQAGLDGRLPGRRDVRARRLGRHGPDAQEGRHAARARSLMKMSGSAARSSWPTQAQDIHLIYLEDDKITVNGRNLLAFDAGIDWDINRLKGGAAGAMAGGLFNMSLPGTGWVAILSDGPPVLLNVALGADLRRRAGGDHVVVGRHHVDQDRLQAEDPDRPRLGRVDPDGLRGPGLGARAAVRGPRRPAPAGGGRRAREPARRLSRLTVDDLVARVEVVHGLLARRAPPARLERRAARGVRSGSPPPALRAPQSASSRSAPASSRPSRQLVDEPRRPVGVRPGERAAQGRPGCLRPVPRAGPPARRSRDPGRAPADAAGDAAARRLRLGRGGRPGLDRLGQGRDVDVVGDSKTTNEARRTRPVSTLAPGVIATENTVAAFGDCVPPRRLAHRPRRFGAPERLQTGTLFRPPTRLCSSPARV